MGTSSPQRSSVFQHSVSTVEGSYGDWTKDSFVKVAYSFLSSRVNTRGGLFQSRLTLIYD